MIKIYTEILFLLMISATSLLATNTETEKLIIACSNHDIYNAKILIENYAQNYTSEIYNEALSSTMGKGSKNINIELLKLLIDNNADINYRKSEDDLTLLHSACYDINANLAKFLIENKADVNAVETYIYSDEEDECVEYSFPLDIIFINLKLLNNKKEDALEIIKYLLSQGGKYSEEYNEEELLIQARQHILEDVKICDAI